MKKHPVFSTLLFGAVIVFSGISVAYYNTKSLAVDENAVLFSKDDEGISVLDFKIYYKDVERFYEDTQPYLPQKAYSTAPYIVGEKEAVTYIMYY